MSIIVFKRSRLWPLFWTSWFQSIVSYPVFLRSILIIPSTPSASEWSLPSRFPDQNFVCISHIFIRATRPGHPIPLYFINVILREAYKLDFSLLRLLQSPATSTRLGPKHCIWRCFCLTAKLNVDENSVWVGSAIPQVQSPYIMHKSPLCKCTYGFSLSISKVTNVMGKQRLISTGIHLEHRCHSNKQMQFTINLCTSSGKWL